MSKALAFLICASLAACGGGSQTAPATTAQPLSNQAGGAPRSTSEPESSAEELEAGEGGQADAERAFAQYEEAVRAANEAMARIQALEQTAADMIVRINEAIAIIDAAQNDADRAAAAAKLKALAREQAELEQRVRAAKEAARKTEERKGVKVSKECLDNPLAKGCQ
jgi:hypothetical protein